MSRWRQYRPTDMPDLDDEGEPVERDDRAPEYHFSDSRCGPAPTPRQMPDLSYIPPVPILAGRR